MRKVGLGVVFVCVAMGLPFVAAAAAAASAVTTFQFSDKGLGAEALYSTFPSTGIPTPGVVYTDTYVNAATDATRFDTGKSVTDALFVDQFSYEFDSSGNFVPVSDNYGQVNGSAVTLSLSKQLDAASASATVPLQACTFDSSGNETCGNGPLLAVSAAWTGQGAVTKTNSHLNFHTKGTNEVSNFHGSFRNASASVSIGGNPAPGALAFADIFNVSQKDTQISH